LIAIAGARAEQERQRQAAERERKQAEDQARFEAQLREFNAAKEARERERAAAEAEAERQRQEAAKAEQERERQAQAAREAKAEQERQRKAEEAAKEKARAEAEAEAERRKQPEPPKPSLTEMLRAAASKSDPEQERRRAAERATIDVDLAKTSERDFTSRTAWALADQLNAERIQLRQDIEASESRGRIAKFFAPTDPEAKARLRELDTKVERLWGMDRWFKQGGQKAREDDLREVPELKAEVDRWKSNHALAVKHGIVKSEEQLRQEAIDRAQEQLRAAKAKAHEFPARTQNKGRSGPDRGGHGMGM
jgi:hypothetical protein